MHVATASRALNPGTRSLVSPTTAQRVLQAAKDLDYRPNPIARSLRTARTHTVGIVIPDLTNPLVPRMVHGVADVLSPAGYDAWIVNTDNDPDRERSQVESLQAKQVDGLIVATARLDSQWFEELYDEGTHIVFATRRSGSGRIPSVTADNASGIALAVDHLVSLGHTRIAHVAGRPDLWSSRARLDGYRAALDAAGVDADRDLVVTGSFDYRSGFEAMRRWVEGGSPPTAVFAASDQMALGVYEALRQAGLRVPDDVSVVGFDDLQEAQWSSPPLTTVRQPLYEMGRTAVRTLHDLSSGVDGQTPRVELATELVVRTSTRPVD